MYKLLFIILLTFTGIQTKAVNPEISALLNQANQAYINEEYSFAVELYEEVLSAGVGSATLYYNLGNAYFKDNQIGRAILNYERALRLRPFDGNVKYNLEIARSRTVDRIEPLPVIFYIRWWNGFVYAMSVDNWARTGIAFVLVMLSALLVYFFSATARIKKIGFLTATACLILAALSFTAAQDQYTHLNKKTEAVVNVQRLTAKSAPGDASPDLFVIHEGTRVSITDELGEWVEIRLANGNVGWLKRQGIEYI